MFPCYQLDAEGEPHAAMCGYFLLLLSWQDEGVLREDTFVWFTFQILLASHVS